MLDYPASPTLHQSYGSPTATLHQSYRSPTAVIQQSYCSHTAVLAGQVECHPRGVFPYKQTCLITTCFMFYSEGHTQTEKFLPFVDCPVFHSAASVSVVPVVDGVLIRLLWPCQSAGSSKGFRGDMADILGQRTAGSAEVGPGGGYNITTSPHGSGSDPRRLCLGHSVFLFVSVSLCFCVSCFSLFLSLCVSVCLSLPPFSLSVLLSLPVHVCMHVIA